MDFSSSVVLHFPYFFIMLWSFFIFEFFCSFLCFKLFLFFLSFPCYLDFISFRLFVFCCSPSVFDSSFPVIFLFLFVSLPSLLLATAISLESSPLALPSITTHPFFQSSTSFTSYLSVEPSYSTSNSQSVLYSSSSRQDTTTPLNQASFPSSSYLCRSFCQRVEELFSFSVF